MANGTILADFAGTVEEARNFAREKGFNLSRRYENNGANGLPSISLRFGNEAELTAGLQKFAEHGWDSGSVLVKRHGRTREAI